MLKDPFWLLDEVGNAALNVVRPSVSHTPKQLVEKQNKLQKTCAETPIPQTSASQKRNREGEKKHRVYPKSSVLPTVSHGFSTAGEGAQMDLFIITPFRMP